VAATLATLKAHPGRVLALFSPMAMARCARWAPNWPKSWPRLDADDRVILTDPVYFGGTVDRTQGSERIVALVKAQGGQAEHVGERAAAGEGSWPSPVPATAS
jgi:UDP-N-acetylmuramate--alanine ligase